MVTGLRELHAGRSTDSNLSEFPPVQTVQRLAQILGKSTYLGRRKAFKAAANSLQGNFDIG
jgi:hypothetical protein